MELSGRINILEQSTKLAQNGGCLSLDDAVLAKQALDALKNGQSIPQAIDILRQVAEVGQKRGVYSLKDAYYIYQAITNEDETPVEETKE